MVLEGLGYSSEVMDGPILAPVRVSQAVPRLWRQLKQGRALLSAPAPLRGSEPATALLWHRRLWEELLRSRPQRQHQHSGI